MNPDHLDSFPENFNLDDEIIDEEEFEQELHEPDNGDENLHDYMIFLRTQPNVEFQQAELGLRNQDTDFDWLASYQNYENHEQLINFVSNLEDVSIEEEDHQIRNINLSDEQEAVLNLVRLQINYIQTGIRDEMLKQSVIVQGKAGSGKTTLIKAIKLLISDTLGTEQTPGNRFYSLIAPTGSAASNIHGKTIHSAFRISVNPDLNQLDGEQLQAFQLNYQDCHFLIIDEFSMVGCTLLRKLDLRCRQIKANESEPFGGKLPKKFKYFLIFLFNYVFLRFTLKECLYLCSVT